MPTSNRNDIYNAVIQKMVSQSLEDQEEQFWYAHCQDTDRELLAYLCRCARDLGHSPRRQEILGWWTLERCFGSWEEALLQAGLEPVRDCPPAKLARIREETERQKQCYRQKKEEKQRKHLQRLEAQQQKRQENHARKL